MHFLTDCSSKFPLHLTLHSQITVHNYHTIVFVQCKWLCQELIECWEHSLRRKLTWANWLLSPHCWWFHLTFHKMLGVCNVSCTYSLALSCAVQLAASCVIFHLVHSVLDQTPFNNWDSQFQVTLSILHTFIPYSTWRWMRPSWRCYRIHILCKMIVTVHKLQYHLTLWCCFTPSTFTRPCRLTGKVLSPSCLSLD